MFEANLSICCIFTCRFQAGDSSVPQLEGEYRSVILALHSKLDSKAAPPILHLDTTYLQEESPNTRPFPTSSSGTQVHTGSSASSQKSPEPMSLLTALMNEIQISRTQDGTVTEAESQSEISSSRIVSPDVTWGTTSDDLTFVENGELTSSPMQSTTVVQPVTVGDRTETTTQPRQTAHAVKPLSLHRKYRSLLRKRQIPGASGKSM